MEDYEKKFEEFWSDIVCFSDGTLNKDAVMRELFDYAFLLDQIPYVYDEVTGGRLSKTTYLARSVIEAFEQARTEYVVRTIDDMVDDGLLIRVT